ncbi:hypothetical protein O6H91_04G115500 [Diphasiastrum complanatum]|uniref:Uncharacterized protein n=1 Tax=Diphasiastrum complanatum TaxID=34168 RepID=A0ACC2E0Z9_DIPCM|nr:hypothetical protein O6H91_04G115500 [Diphasiastrum complanatum]
MDALMRLTDILARCPDLAKEKLPFICSQCPSQATLREGSPPPTAAQLQGILAVTKFLATCESSLRRRDLLLTVLDFVKALPYASKGFWPKFFSSNAKDEFFPQFLKYLVTIVDVWPDVAQDVSSVITGVIQTLTDSFNQEGEPYVFAESPALRLFLTALARSCPPLNASDVEIVADCLLEHWILPTQAPSFSSSSETSFQSSPYVSRPQQPDLTNGILDSLKAQNGINVSESVNPNDVSDDPIEKCESPVSNFFTIPSSTSSTPPKISHDQVKSSQVNGNLNSFPHGWNDSTPNQKHARVLSVDETVEALERHETAFRLFEQILDRVKIQLTNGVKLNNSQLEQLKDASSRQLKTILPLLKVRKRELPMGGVSLEAKMSWKLQVSQAAAVVQTKCFLITGSQEKSFRNLPRDTFVLLFDVADACIVSSWRRTKACETLFETLLISIAEIFAVHGNQMLPLLLHRFKMLVLSTCAYVDTWGTRQGPVFDSLIKSIWRVVDTSWQLHQPAVESFLLSLAAYVRERVDQDEKEKQVMPVMQLNVISLLADLAAMLNKPEVVEVIMPLFIQSLEEGDACGPSLLRLRLLDAVARLARLGFEKPYREVVVLMTKAYLDKLSIVGSTLSRTLAPEATTERVETLPLSFVLIASGLRQPHLRADYRQRLLTLCSDVGLVAEAKSGRSGADLLGPLLPAVAEVCSDFEPTQDLDFSLLKLFRNLWFYIVLFGLAPPIQKIQSSSKSLAISTNSLGSMSAMALQAVAGPYLWNDQWSASVRRIAESTPPLVVSSVKWLEDEWELNALHNPGSRRGSSNEKAAVTQRAALAAALGGKVDVSSLSTISVGVKATYLLAVAFLEVLRFGSNGGVQGSSMKNMELKSSLICTFKYLETPNLMPVVYSCLTAIVHRAFDGALQWLGERTLASGDEAEQREAVLAAHTCYLIENLAHRNENIRDIVDSFLTQLRNSFAQVLWNVRCVDSLLLLLGKGASSGPSVESGIGSRLHVQYRIQEWITSALLLVPTTAQGLLQEQFRKLNPWTKASHTSELLALLSKKQLEPPKMEGTNGTLMSSIPAVSAAAAAAAGANSLTGEIDPMEYLSTGIVSANVKSNYVGEIVGMKKSYEEIGGFSRTQALPSTHAPGHWAIHAISNGRDVSVGSKWEELSPIENLITKFVQSLKQFVTAAGEGLAINTVSFREACLRATALILSDMSMSKQTLPDAYSKLLRLLCWCPAYIFTAGAMETGIFVWTWLLSAAPQLGSQILSELVDAWLWTIYTGRGLFAAGVANSGPAAELRPQLMPGEPVVLLGKDPVEGIAAHRLWLGFLLDRFEIVRNRSSEELLLIGRLVQGSVKNPNNFSSHPAARGAFFTLMLLGLKFCACQWQLSLRSGNFGINLLEDRVYRAALAWFAVEPGWYDSKLEGTAQAEAQTMSVFVQNLALDKPEVPLSVDMNVQGHGSDNGHLGLSNLKGQSDSTHPVWGKIENYSSAREKRRQLLLMLCQHEADRLDTWAYPLREFSVPRIRVNSERWVEYAKIAWGVDPRIALTFVSRFPTVTNLRAEVTAMVQAHISELTDIPEALPYFVTPKAVDDDSPVLQKLPHWAPCSITCALEFLTPPYKGHPRVMAYVLRVMESYPPERVTFFMPQLVQALRYDEGGLVEGYLLVAARRSNLFAHILIWQLQGEEPPTTEEARKESGPQKGNSLYEIVPRVKQRIIDSFTPEALDVFIREFRFFDKVTSISGILYPLPKENRQAAIRRELEKIEIEGDDLYLPTAPNKLVRGIELDSGIPLQSAAKVPIMITFDVVDKDGDQKDRKLQACIFKVGDDCRQDVLALQVIALLRDIFQASGLNLYLFPYGVLPTGYERGIIEVVPNTRSRNQMGEVTDGGLYEIFQQEYGEVGTPRFEAARDNFIVSSAGYAVASLLLQPKDRHNGNLLFDNEGRLVHIDFGFILETSPGGNLRFESAQFKLSHEMTQLLDPSGTMKSDTWNRFVRLCVKGYLAARDHMDGIVNTVLLMVDSGLPCFSRGDPIGNLRKRFHPELSEREAANFMRKTCEDAYNKWTTTGYDLIQYLQQRIEK